MQKISRTKTAGRIRQLLREKGITARKVQEALELENGLRIFPGMEVMCDNLSLGVSCHTGPGALGIGCSVCPEFEDAEE